MFEAHRYFQHFSPPLYSLYPVAVAVVSRSFGGQLVLVGKKHKHSDVNKLAKTNKPIILQSVHLLHLAAVSLVRNALSTCEDEKKSAQNQID